jgi:iron complex outermembrane receptor protein
MQAITSRSRLSECRAVTGSCSKSQSRRMLSKRPLLVATASVSVFALALPAMAQDANSNEQEIIVTARKRQESILNVPVVTQVITGDQLTRLNTPADVQAIVPSLRIGDAVQSSGTRVFLRGIGTTSGDPGVDQSVSLNIDGLQLTNGLAYKSGLFDLGRIEVLKGPQGLFYGKNSPGGVVSLYSADPTDRFELIAGAAYEIEARTKQADLVVSGPVTHALKLRLAARFSDSDGYFKNPAVALAGTGGLTPTSRRISGTRSWIVRGTVLWNPSAAFDARLKVNYVSDHNIWVGSQQFTSCPDGTAAPPGKLPYIGGGEDCHLDRTFRLVQIDPAAFPGNAALGVKPLWNNGIPTRDAKQWYGTLEMNYRPIPDVTFTSLTAYYHLFTEGYLQSGNSTFAGPSFVSQQRFRRRDVTEELRVNSEFSGPINFTGGIFFQDAILSNLSTQRGNVLQGVAAIRGLGTHTVKITTNSVFGQLRWEVVPHLELAAGARWSDETRTDKPFNLLANATTPVGPVTIAVPEIHTNNVKPEFTATYRPTDKLTFFASYKTGYKSGSLNIATGASTGQNNSYGNETVRGAEVGLKSRLLNRRLALNLSAYDYHYKGLQVTTLVPGANLLPIARTLNAGRARTYGVELEAAYNPPTIEGLNLHAILNWNHARFQELTNVPCWGGQEIAEGCNLQFTPGNQALPPAAGSVVVGGKWGFFAGQDLSGLPLLNAPKWSGSFGFDYQRPIGGGLTLVISNNNHFGSKYLVDLGRRADFFQGSYFKTDLSLTLKGPKDRWEVSFIGRNLTGKLTRSTCANGNFAGGFIIQPSGQVTGGTIRGPAGIDEVVCYVDPGRELWLSVTLRPFK